MFAINVNITMAQICKLNIFSGIENSLIFLKVFWQLLSVLYKSYFQDMHDNKLFEIIVNEKQLNN